jgi:hypothetical protein
MDSFPHCFLSFWRRSDHWIISHHSTKTRLLLHGEYASIVGPFPDSVSRSKRVSSARRRLFMASSRVISSHLHFAYNTLATFYSSRRAHQLVPYGGTVRPHGGTVRVNRERWCPTNVPVSGIYSDQGPLVRTVSLIYLN